MKTCMNCNIKIGGRTDTCPLCQNSLSGEATENNWPTPTRLKTQAFLYKLQLFVVLAVIVVGLSLDFLLNLNNGKHYSLIFSLWFIVFEWDLSSNIKKLFVPSRVVSISILHICILLLITGNFFDFFDIMAFMVVPILIGAALLANTALSMTDTSDNAMIYLLENILLIFIVYAVLKAKHIDTGLVWTICLMLGLVSLIAVIIFKGRKVSSEIQRRMNF